jgi:hypothetical protein
VTRKLRPCGTRSAYQRHRYRGETPCDACREANSAKNGGGRAAANVFEREMADALDADQPVIVWRLDPIRRIQVAVYIDDPHAETPKQRQRDEEFHVDMDAYFAPQPAVEPECTDENLLAAGTREI